MSAGPPEWMREALCAEVGGDLWFPEKGGPIQKAKRVCRRCTVTDDCLEWAIENDERDGIYGGMAPAERHRLAKLRRRAS